VLPRPEVSELSVTGVLDFLCLKFFIVFRQNFFFLQGSISLVVFTDQYLAFFLIHCRRAFHRPDGPPAWRGTVSRGYVRWSCLLIQQFPSSQILRCYAGGLQSVAVPVTG